MARKLNILDRIFGVPIEKRSIQTVSPSDPFTSWASLFSAWGLDDVTLTEATAQSIPAYSRAIDIISSQIASLPISVIRKSGETIEEDTLHPLHRLLKYRPHPLFSSYDFRSALVRQMMLRGNCTVFPVLDANGNPIRLEFLKGAFEVMKTPQGDYYYKFTESLNDRDTYEAGEVLHFKLNSIDGVTGQSPLKIFRGVLERSLAELQLANKYYTNGGQVSGLLTPSQPLSKEQAKQAMDMWSQNNVGQDKVGKVGLIPFGFDYKRLGDTMAESQMTEARSMTVNDIANITGVNPVMLSNLGRATFANVEELNRVLVQFTLRSYAKIIEEEFNTKMFPSTQMGKRKVKFNFDGLLRGDTAARAAFYREMYNIRAINPNEIRAHEGMNPYEGGELFGQPLASNSTEPQQTESNEGK